MDKRYMPESGIAPAAAGISAEAPADNFMEADPDGDPDAASVTKSLDVSADVSAAVYTDVSAAAIPLPPTTLTAA